MNEGWSYEIIMKIWREVIIAFDGWKFDEGQGKKDSFDYRSRDPTMVGDTSS